MKIFKKFLLLSATNKVLLSPYLVEERARECGQIAGNFSFSNLLLLSSAKFFNKRAKSKLKNVSIYLIEIEMILIGKFLTEASTRFYYGNNTKAFTTLWKLLQI